MKCDGVWKVEIATAPDPSDADRNTGQSETRDRSQGPAIPEDTAEIW